jgi:hypothetical protein
MGNGLFALTDIGTGQDILTIQKPFVAVLDTPRLQDTCSGCLGMKQQQQEQNPEEAVKLKSCTRCQVVRYCDKVGNSSGCRLHNFSNSFNFSLYPRMLTVSRFTPFSISLVFASSCLLSKKALMWIWQVWILFLSLWLSLDELCVHFCMCFIIQRVTRVLLQLLMCLPELSIQRLEIRTLTRMPDLFKVVSEDIAK